MVMNAAAVRSCGSPSPWSDHGLTRAATASEQAVVAPPVRSMGQEQRHGRPREHALGGSAKNELPDPGMPVRPHDQKIGIPIRHMGFEYLTDPATFGIDFVEDHLDTVSGQMLRKLDARVPRVDRLFICHGDNANPFGALKNWHRVRDRPRSRSTEVPGHDHGIEREGRGSLAGVRQDDGWAPGAEDDRFSVPLIDVVPFGHRYYRQVAQSSI